MSPRAFAVLIAVAVTAASAGAQSGRARKVRERHRNATAVHQAWLQENLDLDSRGAIQSYEKLRRNSPKSRPERWIAIARLAELGRLGVIHPEPGTVPMQAPPEVQKALDLLAQPVPWQTVITNPEAPVDLPRLRPATENVVRWGRDQIGPDVQTRWNMRWRGRDRSTSGRNRRLNRSAAYDMLEFELQSPNSAESLRELMFVGWKPPVLEVGVEAALQRADERLRERIESEGSGRFRRLLQALQTRVQQLSENDPKDALALLMRLPFLAEELLLPKQETSEEAPKDPPEGKR
jgi:hypothetical protein